MTRLETAVSLAKGGLCLFPLIPNTKKPLIKDWEKKASQFPLQLEEWFGGKQKVNIGIATGPSGLTVLDIDVKGDVDGFKSIDENNYETPVTFSVETPSGGVHHYYLRGDSNVRNTASEFGKGIDTRAIGGYVVGPSSIIDGKKYEIINAHEIVEAPQWMLNGTKTEAIITEEKEASKIDWLRTIEWLSEEAPISVKGQGGDTTLYQVACRVRDFGLSEEHAFVALWDYYNPRCPPHWSESRLKEKIHNAYKYGKNSKGSDVLPFDTFETQEAAELIPLQASSLNLDLPVRDWVLGHRLITGFVSLTVAPGGTGKSMYTMIEAIAIATGRSLLGTKPRKTGPVIIYNTEDPMDEIQRRVVAIAMQHEIPLDELNNVYLLSGINDPLRVAKTVQGVTRATQDATRLTNLVEKTKAVLVVIDPFIRVHSVEENDNNAIDAVVQIFASLADLQHCSVSIVHHTRKMPAGTGAGDMDTARGASALVSAARISSTISTMSDKEAKTLQIPLQERYWYVRVDNAKGNMSPPAQHAEWYRKVSVQLTNGDSVGTLEPVDFKSRYLEAEESNNAKARVLAPDLVKHFGLGCHSLGIVTTWLRKNGFDGDSESTVRRRLQGYYEREVVVDEYCFKYTADGNRSPKYGIEITKDMSREEE